MSCMLFLVLPIQAWGVTATGIGETSDMAANGALRQAVEMVVGTILKSQILVEEGLLIKDEIITHSKGYVSSYKVVQETHLEDGSYEVVIEAEVNEGRIQSHVEAMEILMKMTGHPKALVIGLADTFDAVSNSSSAFVSLTNAVVDVFRDRFRFDVLDWALLRSQHPNLAGMMDKRRAVQAASQLGANFLVLVRLQARTVRDVLNGELSLEAIRAADGIILGKEASEVSAIMPNRLGSQALSRLAVNAAKEEVFGVSIQLAKGIVEDLQRGAEKGKGMRYTIELLRFPQDAIRALVQDEFSILSGYVRHNIETASDKTLRLSYWSHLTGIDLMTRIKTLLNKKKYKFQEHLNGQSLAFKWVNPRFH